MAEENHDLVEPEGPDPAQTPSLPPEVVARRLEALRLIRQFGDPVLRSEGRAVERFDDALREEVRQMGALMADALGIGLAAPQVGIPHRLLVYRIASEGPPAALVNPKIQWSSRDKETAEEGCLSLPGVHVDVERPVHVRVSASDEHGDGVLVEASGLEARVIQHEIDHLDGVLILDRASREQRKAAIRAMREREQRHAASAA